MTFVYENLWQMLEQMCSGLDYHASVREGRSREDVTVLQQLWARGIRKLLGGSGTGGGQMPEQVWSRCGEGRWPSLGVDVPAGVMW